MMSNISSIKFYLFKCDKKYDLSNAPSLFNSAVNTEFAEKGKHQSLAFILTYRLYHNYVIAGTGSYKNDLNKLKICG